MTQPVYPPGILFDSGCYLGRTGTPEFLFLRGGPAAGAVPAQRQPKPTVPRPVHSWQAGPALRPGLRPLTRRPVVRTGVVRGITDSYHFWGDGRKRYRQILTLPTRASVMVNPKCRSCDHAADAGAYCSSCAAGIMAKALNPFFGGRRKKLPRTRPPRPSAPSTQHLLFQ